MLRSACLSGRVYFRGNDRSPGDKAVDVNKSAAEILGQYYSPGSLSAGWRWPVSAARS